jgi:hypothetical protein
MDDLEIAARPRRGAGGAEKFAILLRAASASGVGLGGRGLGATACEEFLAVVAENNIPKKSEHRGRKNAISRPTKYIRFTSC